MKTIIFDANVSAEPPKTISEAIALVNGSVTEVCDTVAAIESAFHKGCTAKDDKYTGSI